MHVCTRHWHRKVTASLDLLQCRVISEWWEYGRGSMYVMGILLQKANKGQLSLFYWDTFIFTPPLLITLVNGRIDSSNVRRQLGTNSKDTGTSVRGSKSMTYYAAIDWEWSFVGHQPSWALFECTMANGELLYPSLKASCVCLEKKNSC